MTTIKQAWIIVRSDFRGDRLKLVWAFLGAVVLMGYMGTMTGMVTDDVLGEGEAKVLADFMLVTVIPMLGFTFSRRTMKYVMEDSYTRMLAYMRSLPVPSAVILCKRKLHTVFSFSLNGVLFFGLIYTLSGSMRHELPLPAYLTFALTWVGYGLIVAGVFIFIELLTSGKAYCGLLFLFMLLSIIAALLISLAGGNLFLYTVNYSKEWGLLSPLMWGTLLLGTASVQLFSAWTIQRLKSRDLV
ncbi:hypothetical protein PAECIP111892_03987 [Paenibacillus auburnensis]|uniref:ABC transporter permease n=1 Tax=Paenibacillus auburnensis TaxID=2905649 RepID=A0ABN8GU54_9BACL|nr:hypothetical protein [Paenibacillus auburnensis]CAH1214205.1 hypothetical protein PAECIP111892_03987 [Paenibacillus auburnensis]